MPLLVSKVAPVLADLYDPYARNNWNYKTNPSYPSTMCQGAFIIDGITADQSTGMTLIRFVLQVLALVVRLSVSIIVAWPTLPLVSGWPAQ